jgi:hypothetical protein
MRKVQFYIVYPVLCGSQYYVATAQGRKKKAIAEAKNWIRFNRLAGEKWNIEVCKKEGV